MGRIWGVPSGRAGRREGEDFNEVPMVNNVRHPTISGDPAPVVGKEGKTTPEDDLWCVRRDGWGFAGFRGRSQKDSLVRCCGKVEAVEVAVE